MEMKGKFRYGGKWLRSRLLENARVLRKDAGEDDCREPHVLFDELLQREMDDAALVELFRGRTNIGLILNDRNRPTPSHLVVEKLMGIDDFRSGLGKVHIATGTHKEPTEEDLRSILGRHYDALEGRIHIHIARDREGHVHYGETTMGTQLRFDRELEDHDLFVFVNSVEPHYFAGFTGGRKSIIPGMAFFDTTETNHSHSLSAGSRTLALKGNPVHEDMEEGARIFLQGKQHISFQIVQGPGRLLCDLKVGDIFTSFQRAVESAKEQFCIPIDGLYDIVVSVARDPLDRTLYQAQKAIENGKLALRDGGVLVLVAECPEGIGQSTFWDLLTMGEDPDEVLERIDSGYVLGYHKAAKIVQLAKRADIFLVSSLDPEMVRRGFMEGFSDLDTALLEAMGRVGEDPDILLIPDGGVTVPLIKEVLS
ncbi:MAG: nickel-dependent lactate racemase [Thermoplasmatota archaeon]